MREVVNLSCVVVFFVDIREVFIVSALQVAVAVDCVYKIVFIACVGTGGTVSGTGRYLKKMKSDIEVIAVEPFESPLITKGYAAPHKIQGIGANFIPENLDMSVVDRVVTVKGDDAFEGARLMASKQGILVGISSGAALCAAIEIAKDEKYKNKNIVVLMPDSGERYMSVDLF